MKINIVPLTIIAAFVLFAAFILSFVFRSFQYSVDLVAKDYYAQEIKYQDQIDKLERSKELQEKIKMQVEGETLKIAFPTELQASNIKGKVYFFRPSDLKMDFTIPFQLTESVLVLDQLDKIQKGAWVVRLDFSSEGKDYYVEQRISL